MKRIIFSFFATILFSAFSFGQSNIKEISLQISKDQDFINLSKSIDVFSRNKFDLNSIKSLIEKEKLTEEEKIKIANSLGFKSMVELEIFSKENENYVKSVANKYSLQNYSSEDLILILDESFILVPSIDDIYETDGRSCGDRFKSCNNGAKAVYFLEIGGCVGLGVSIAGASFGSASAFGVGAYIACSGAAAVHLGSMLDACQDSYDDCKDKQ